MILPPPASSFEWRHLDGRPVLVCGTLEAHARHLFTTEPWALGRRASTDGNDGWREVATAVGVPLDRLARVRQVHGRAVVVASTDAPLVDADILVSRDPTIALAVQSADCVPMLMADPETGAVAAAHAGWRGLAERVPHVAVEALARHFGSRPDALVVAVGPSIGACCYEVGADVRDAFSVHGFSSATLDRWFFPTVQPRPPANPSLPRLRTTPHPGRSFFDGWASARDQLVAAGVDETRILAAGLCTASHPGVFCSYRRDGSPAGRMAAAIVARPRRP